MLTVTRPSAPVRAAVHGPERPPAAARVAVALLSGAFVLASLMLPLWRAHLVAPQYPDGLDLLVYGSRVAGDVDEISSLNHYVGMRPFDVADVPEMALWPLAVAGGVTAAGVAGLARRRWLRRTALAYLWLVPAGVLADIQFRLHQYGHDIDPGAAFRIPEFTPWVIGPTRIWNFVTWARPGAGFFALVAAAALVTFGPGVMGRARARSARAPGAALVVLALTLLPALPASAEDPHVHHRRDSAPPHAPAPHTDHRAPGAPAEAGGPLRDLASVLDGAAPGATITLPGGRWRGDVVIDVPVILDGGGTAVIEGAGAGSVLLVRAPGTVLRGLTVRGSGGGPVGDPAGIRIEADGVSVERVVIADAYNGIAVAGAADVRLVGNTVIGRGAAPIESEAHALDAEGHDSHGGGAHGAAAPRGDGIWIWSSAGVLVRDSHIHDARDGVYIAFGESVLLDRNHVTGSRYAVHSMYATDLVLAENQFERNLSGAVLMYRGPALLLRNSIIDNRSPATGFGVLLKDIDSAQMVENVIVANRVGLHLDGPAGAAEPTRVRANTIAGHEVGVAIYASGRGRFSANSFANNLVQVTPMGDRVPRDSEWSEGGWGNYWSGYRGYESAMPGHGAVPHAEGGTLATALSEAPVLTAIASAPGPTLLRAFEERWSLRSPILTDHLPLTRPVSPPLVQTAAAGAGRGFIIAGAILLLAAGASLAGAQRPADSAHRLRALRTGRKPHVI